MAITKIHPIKVNLKAALDYIENPDKTDDKMLVSSFGCSYETADIEFQMLLAQAFKKGNNLAHHLIQAFEPGETTPEQAHEIGRQLADEVLQGKYPYVLTTHIDKVHLHNHIIFCALDMVQQRKYISNRRSNAYIRRTSDRLCKENGLSVVKPGKDKGKSYAEWDAQRKDSLSSLLISLAVMLLPTIIYTALGGSVWISTVLPSAGIGLQNNFLYQLYGFNFLYVGDMSFWTPYVILISAVIEIPAFTVLAIRSYCKHRVA